MKTSGEKNKTPSETWAKTRTDLPKCSGRHRKPYSAVAIEKQGVTCTGFHTLHEQRAKSLNADGVAVALRTRCSCTLQCQREHLTSIMTLGAFTGLGPNVSRQIQAHLKPVDVTSFGNRNLANIISEGEVKLNPMWLVHHEKRRRVEN